MFNSYLMVSRWIGKIHLLKVEWYISYLFQRMDQYASGIPDQLKRKFSETSLTSYGSHSCKLICSGKMDLERWVYQEYCFIQGNKQLPSGLLLMKEIFLVQIGVLSLQVVLLEKKVPSLQNTLSLHLIQIETTDRCLLQRDHHFLMTCCLLYMISISVFGRLQQILTILFSDQQIPLDLTILVEPSVLPELVLSLSLRLMESTCGTSLTNQTNHPLP